MKYLLLIHKDDEVDDEFRKLGEGFTRLDIPQNIIDMVEEKGGQGCGYGGDNYIFVETSKNLTEMRKIIKGLSPYGKCINSTKKFNDFVVIDFA